MPRNEGFIDRFVRIAVGIILIALVFIGPKTAWGWIGVIPLSGVSANGTDLRL